MGNMSSQELHLATESDVTNKAQRTEPEEVDVSVSGKIMSDDNCRSDASAVEMQKSAASKNDDTVSSMATGGEHGQEQDIEPSSKHLDFKETSSEHHSELNEQVQNKPSASQEKQELDILLLGKTGQGKSATGNSILGRRAFETSTSSTSVTFDVQVQWTDIDPYTVKVVDGPGIGDTRLDNVAATRKACDDMAEAMSRCPNGFHAFLLVLKYGSRFTKEEQDAIRMLKSMFGEDIVRDYCVIIVTHGENFDMNYDEDKVADFNGWMKSQTGPFQELLKECNYRAVLFRNRKKDPNIKREQVQQLLEMVESLKFRDVRYTDHHFQKTTMQRKRLIVEAKLPHLREEVMKNTNLIIAGLSDLRKTEDDADGNEGVITSLENRVSKLLQNIDEEDSGTGAMKNLRETVNRVQENVQLEKAANAERKKNKERQEQLRRDLEDELKMVEKQHAEMQEKLSEQLKNAAAEEKDKIQEKMNEAHKAALDRESKIRQEYKERLNKAAQSESKRLEDKRKELNAIHDKEIKDLEALYKRMGEDEKKRMQGEINNLKEKLRLEQERALIKIKFTITGKTHGRSVVSKFGPFTQLMEEHYYNRGLPAGSLKFYVRGREIKPTDTPYELGLQDGDEIVTK